MKRRRVRIRRIAITAVLLAVLAYTIKIHTFTFYHNAALWSHFDAEQIQPLFDFVIVRADGTDANIEFTDSTDPGRIYSDTVRRNQIKIVYLDRGKWYFVRETGKISVWWIHVRIR